MAAIRGARFNEQDRLETRWRRVLRAALERGWDVVQISALHGPWPEPRPVHIQMLELVGFAGRYDALALPASAAALPYNFLFVPSQAAILPLERRHNLVLQ